MKIAILAAALLLVSTTAHADWWKPVAADEWQWMIDHPLRTNNATDMGTGKAAFSGATAPATDPKVYDIDGFSNTAATVTALHGMGKKVVCYIEVGAAENYRADYAQFQAIPGALGKRMPGYSAEQYIDVRIPAVVDVIKARIKMCHDKGFDAIEPDIDEAYANGKRITGFTYTQADFVTYMTTLTAYAHSLGVAMWSKNCDDTEDGYCAKLATIVDAALSEQCNEYNTCGQYAAPWSKPVFNAEYGLSTANFCPTDNARGALWNGTKFPVSLKGGRSPCK